MPVSVSRNPGPGVLSVALALGAGHPKVHLCRDRLNLEHSPWSMDSRLRSSGPSGGPDRSITRLVRAHSSL